MMETLTPQVEPLSIDEAFMDLSGTEALHGGAAGAIADQAAEPRSGTSAGSPSRSASRFNKFLAKTASDLDKPRGFSVIGRAEALAFLEPRSVATLPGVGPAGATALERNGLKQIGDIRAAGPQRMRALYGDWGAHLFALSMADDPRVVDPDGERKSISSGDHVLRGRLRDRSAGRYSLAALRKGRRALPRRRDGGAHADAEAEGYALQDHHAAAAIARSRRCWRTASSKPRANCWRATPMAAPSTA